MMCWQCLNLDCYRFETDAIRGFQNTFQCHSNNRAFQFQFNHSDQLLIESGPKMESYSRFTRCIFKWEAFLLDLVGHNMLDLNYRRNLNTYLIYALVVVALVAEMYSILYYDLSTKIFCSIGIVLVVQVSQKKEKQIENFKLYMSRCFTHSMKWNFFVGHCKNVSHSIHR